MFRLSDVADHVVGEVALPRAVLLATAARLAIVFDRAEVGLQDLVEWPQQCQPWRSGGSTQNPYEVTERKNRD
jgi:hypothetical protein